MITAPELEKYGQWSSLFAIVKPGITGYWQINGRQEVSYSERVAMDLTYLENWNLALDLKILVQTPLNVLKGRGAY
jgi:undecaprenyl-phosphate galactose phosphotransferase